MSTRTVVDLDALERLLAGIDGRLAVERFTLHRNRLMSEKYNLLCDAAPALFAELRAARALREAMEPLRERCGRCDGTGTLIVPEHDPSCRGGCESCPIPVQVQCNCFSGLEEGPVNAALAAFDAANGMGRWHRLTRCAPVPSATSPLSSKRACAATASPSGSSAASTTSARRWSHAAPSWTRDDPDAALHAALAWNSRSGGGE